ncbi:MAG: hypothetical protein AAF191_11850 [Verrucomicrobiota bacterium]
MQTRHFLLLTFLGSCWFSLSAQDLEQEEIQGLGVGALRDWVETNLEILGHEKVPEVTIEQSLRELAALRKRAQELGEGLGDSETDQVLARQLQGVLEDIDRQVRQHGGSPEGEQLMHRFKQMGSPQDREERVAAIEELNQMIDVCSRAMRDLYRRKNAGDLSSSELSNLMHGPHGYDRIILALIHRKDDLRREMLKEATADRKKRDENQASIMDELDRDDTRAPSTSEETGMTEEDMALAAAAISLEGEGLTEEEREARMVLVAVEASLPSPSEWAMERSYVEQEERVRLEEDLRQARIEDARQRALAQEELKQRNEHRRSTEAAVEAFAAEADARARGEGRSHWTEKEEGAYAKLMERSLELAQPTALEVERMLEKEKTRLEVRDAIRRLTPFMGMGLSEEEIDRRLQDFRETEAMSRDWREFFAMGQMYSEVAVDRHQNQEVALGADLQEKAASWYLQDPNRTAEERRVARQIQLAAVQRREAATQAVLMDEAIIVGGAAVDLATMGVTGPATTGAKHLRRALGSGSGRAGSVAIGISDDLVAAGSSPGPSTLLPPSKTPPQPNLIDESLRTIEAHDLGPVPKTPSHELTIEEIERRIVAARQRGADPPSSPNLIDESLRTIEDYDLGPLPQKSASLRSPTMDELERRVANARRSPFAESTTENLIDDSLRTLENHELGQVPETMQSSLNSPRFAESAAAERVLKRQNMAAEEALTARLARQAEESQQSFERALQEGRGLTERELGDQYHSVMARNTNQEMNRLLQEARRLQLSEAAIQEATEMAHLPLLPRQGAADAVHQLSKLVAEGNGFRVIPVSEALGIMQTATRVARGNAGPEEIAFLRRNMEAARQRGGDFFEELHRTGTIAREELVRNGGKTAPELRGTGYQPVTHEKLIRLMEAYADANGVTSP